MTNRNKIKATILLILLYIILSHVHQGLVRCTLHSAVKTRDSNHVHSTVTYLAQRNSEFQAGLCSEHRWSAQDATCVQEPLSPTCNKPHRHGEKQNTNMTQHCMSPCTTACSRRKVHKICHVINFDPFVLGLWCLHQKSKCATETDVSQFDFV